MLFTSGSHAVYSNLNDQTRWAEYCLSTMDEDQLDRLSRAVRERLRRQPVGARIDAQSILQDLVALFPAVPTDEIWSVIKRQCRALGIELSELVLGAEFHRGNVTRSTNLPPLQPKRCSSIMWLCLPITSSGRGHVGWASVPHGHDPPGLTLRGTFMQRPSSPAVAFDDPRSRFVIAGLSRVPWGVSPSKAHQGNLSTPEGHLIEKAKSVAAGRLSVHIVSVL